MSPQLLERFHRALIEEIQTQRPEYLTSPFTVAEIYLNLVPYSSHRDRIGVEINGDYEDALIRLLAGEGGFLVLESEPALRDLKAELDSSNPNTGIYRKFAAVDVRLNSAFLEVSADDPVPLAGPAPLEDSMVEAQLGIVPPGVDIFADPAPEAQYSTFLPDAPPAGFAESPAERRALDPDFVAASFPDLGPVRPDTLAQDGCACPACGGELPQRKELNFCPFCGTDLMIHVCSACGEEVEIEWRFCASCGEEASE